ncbi:MAG: hypothetical protein IT453_22810, partial [Planctomycetes bacterium]|nr:hypothetical protein [Planctomycetota bacterium]
MSALTALTCPSCRAVISKHGLDLARRVVTCERCGAVTALPGSGSAAASTSVEHARPAPRHVLAEPACVDTRELS